ncbi:MAG TPA: cytochrome C [Campylobacterales bacterium]|nr:cytochrome C [Campylobacterales bacterium]HHD80117.1 cytochrome C [Campylobacterales bacterium]HHH51646.1 cytochrome C [Campylobacterales bacterium]
MKRLLLIGTIATTISYAGGYTQADRITDMQKMAQAMQDIQSGFFYNNNDIVKDGVKTLKETIIKVRPIDSEVNTKDIYEKWINNSLKMTNKIQKKITQKATDIEDRFKSGDAIQALQAYSKITQQCMKCHVQIRKW